MIQIKNLYKSFRDKVILEDLNLTLKSGETLTIIGGSGKGKSVLIKHIVGLLKPDKGEVLINGVNICDVNEKRLFSILKDLGFVFQNGALFDSLNVRDNIIFGLNDAKQKSEEELNRIVSEALEKVGMSGVEDLMPAELSGGMKKRVAIARAIAKKPKIILYDEPTTGLDPIMSDVINELIISVNSPDDISSIVITHDMTSAYKISDRIAMLYEGKILEVGSVDEIKNSNNPIVRQFIEGRSKGPIKIR